ncbi:MAG TPA: hypothetical protein VN040_20700 [Pseudosphingobacterium sp.]|nr:hypothetical protein [Pseudosphingobacterium sp.]
MAKFAPYFLVKHLLWAGLLVSVVLKANSTEKPSLRAVKLDFFDSVENRTKLPYQEKQEKKNQEKEKKGNPADIKQVPKARKQVKPAKVQSRVRIKPIKIIRPRVKKPS